MTIHEVFADHSAVTARAALELPPVLERTVTAVHECLRAGGKILACGNGGSAADAQHLAAELVGRFREERQALPAIALTADTALLTALGNDYGYERVFARQVEALAQPRDVLLAFSTSGNSPNVVQAAQTARRLGRDALDRTAHVLVDHQVADHPNAEVREPVRQRQKCTHVTGAAHEACSVRISASSDSQST